MEKRCSGSVNAAITKRPGTVRNSGSNIDLTARAVYGGYGEVFAALQISPETVEFVREHLRSAWALEQLVFLRRHGDRGWTIDELVKELRSSKALVTANLAAFERAGVILKDESGRYRIASATPALEKVLADIESAYSERPVSLINMVWSADHLRDLADAFKIRKDPK